MQHVKIMKRIRILFLLFFIILVSSVKAEVHPPSPVNANATAFDNDIPVPGEVEMPIDENIVFLLIAGLILGTSIVYKNKIKKASI